MRTPSLGQTLDSREKHLADADTVAVVEGPKGSAKIIEIWDQGRLIEHQVEMNGVKETAANLGDAYIIAGEKVGKPV